MNCIIPERRNIDNDNCYKRILSNGVVECYSKEYYNPNFTRKSDELKVNTIKVDTIEDIKKELLLLEIDNYLL
jgi:hypothetical protein